MKEKIYLFLVRLIPNKIKYWVIIEVWSYLTVKVYPNKVPDEVTWKMACDYLEGKKLK